MSNDFGLANPGRREAAVAVAVACLLILVSWIASNAGDDPPPPADRSSLASTPGDDLRELDVSSDVKPRDIEGCLTTEFAKNAKDVEVLYSRIQQSQHGEVPVLVLRNSVGELRLCDSFGGTAPSVAPVRLADDETPVTLLSNGRQSWDCDGTRLAGFAISHWLSVGEVVDRVELRFVIDSAFGPWYTTEADEGFAHVHGWLEMQNNGAAVAVQIRVLSADGEVVPQQTVSLEPQGIPGCNGRNIDLG